MTDDPRAAELAQAEAEAAEAAAAAAEARARAARLRREFGATEPEPVDEAQPPASAGEDAAADADESSHDESKSDDDAASTEEAATATAEPSPKRAWWRLERSQWAAVGTGVAIVVICVSTALSGYFVAHHRNVAERTHRAAEYAAAAQQGIVTLMSLDYNSAKEDVQRVIDNATGDFKDNFQDTADDFIKVVEQAKVGTETTVKATAVQSMSDDSAVVLVAATSKITNAAGAKQDPRPWRLSVTVTRDGDQLKLSKVEFVV